MLVTVLMADAVAFDDTPRSLWRVVMRFSASRSASNSSVPWCSNLPWEILWALPEIFRPSMAMSLPWPRCAGAPRSFSAAITGRRQRS